MEDEVIPGIADEQLQIVLGDLKFEGLEVLEAVKQPDGTWTLKVRKASNSGVQNPAAPKVIVPADWMPNCNMKRIVCHWTAGGYRAGDHDRESYHILIEGDGRLVRGDH